MSVHKRSPANLFVCEHMPSSCFYCDLLIFFGNINATANFTGTTIGNLPTPLLAIFITTNFGGRIVLEPTTFAKYNLQPFGLM